MAVTIPVPSNLPPFVILQVLLAVLLFVEMVLLIPQKHVMIAMLLLQMDVMLVVFFSQGIHALFLASLAFLRRVEMVS